MSVTPEKPKPYGVIYTVTNRVNGKQYVGQTVQSIGKRWISHVQRARAGENGCRALYNAIRKYGASVFHIEAIIACDSQEELNQMEIMAIIAGDTISYGYNLKTGGDNARLGIDARARISAAKVGHPAHNKGQPMSSEQRAKLSEINRGKTHTPESRAKMSATHKGRKCPKSPEHRAKIATTLRGRKLSDEHRAKLSGERNHSYGKKFSDEHRAKIGVANLGKHTRGVERSDGVTFPSLIAAAKSVLGKSVSIGAACRGRIRTYKGFIWRYTSE